MNNPRFITTGGGEPGVGDELLDLVKTAYEHADRSLRHDGHIPAFVMYEEHSGEVHVRELDASDSERAMPRAREVARALDEHIPRLVAVATGWGSIGRRRH